MNSKMRSFILIAGMLITGTINTITKKVQFDATAPGYYNYSANGTRTVHKFNKPWFQTWTMFMGEILCLLVFMIVRYRKKRQIIAEAIFPEVSFDPDVNTDVPKFMANKIFAWVFVLPAAIDMTSSTLQGIGLLYIDASVWQMMRGSLIIFAGILSMLFLKRRLRCFHWLGMFINVAGLVLVGVSSVLKSKSTKLEPINTSPLSTLLGVFLVLLGAFGTACQVIVEEKLLKGKSYHALHAVGMEGVFGFVLTGAVALPIVHFIPGSDLNGRYENFADAIFMVFSSGVIFSMVLLNIFSIAFFNYFGLSLTKHLSAVHRTLIDTIRTVFVWLTGLVMYYAIDENYGEAFDKSYGLIQIDGFALLIVGTFIYNKIVKLDWIRGCETLMSTDEAEIEENAAITVSERDDEDDERIINEAYQQQVRFSERSPLLQPNKRSE